MAFKAALLRKKLKEEGRTRAFLAELTSKHERTVSRWLNGSNAPKAKDLEKIATALNCRPQDFDPRYADEGPGVPVSVRVSPASRNAFELLRFRYGVTHTQVVELAPVLFSIFAARALAVPAEDLALDREARRLGHDSPIFSRSYERDQGFTLDERAAAEGKCFGADNFDPQDAEPRNLFFEAISRICSEMGDRIRIRIPAAPDAGDAVSAAGFAIEGGVLSLLTSDEPALIDALAFGKIRLADIADELLTLEEDVESQAPKILQRELDVANARHLKELEKRRQESLAKLETWSEFYSRRHPALAEEYSRIVGQHCHEEGWAPADYGSDFRELVWADPYHERRFINEATLPDYQQRIAAGGFAFSHNDPVVIRLRELESHRSKLKAEFEEMEG